MNGPRCRSPLFWIRVEALARGCIEEVVEPLYCVLHVGSISSCIGTLFGTRLSEALGGGRTGCE